MPFESNIIIQSSQYEMHVKASRQATVMSQLPLKFMRSLSAPDNLLLTPSVASNLSDLY